MAIAQPFWTRIKVERLSTLFMWIGWKFNGHSPPISIPVHPASSVAIVQGIIMRHAVPIVRQLVTKGVPAAFQFGHKERWNFVRRVDDLSKGTPLTGRIRIMIMLPEHVFNWFIYPTGRPKECIDLIKHPRVTGVAASSRPEG